MAADLKDTPRAGLTVQLCGDAHLSNFGVFASPERTLLFDLNDFDETLPGPFEYDVKRMAASFTIAARHNGFGKAEARDATLAAVRGLPRGHGRVRRDGRPRHLVRPPLRSGPARGPSGPWRPRRRTRRGSRRRRRRRRQARKPPLRHIARERRPRGAPGSSRRACRRRAPATACRRWPSSASSSTAGTASSASPPSSSLPVISRPPTGSRPTSCSTSSTPQFRDYRATLQSDRRHLLERFELVDMARKVVGVGSVGTRAFIVLLQGRDQQDPLFLQVKEATPSVLEDHLPKSRHQPGARVVHGQRMMQAASDIFLGWTKGAQEGRFLYWRQLRDMKGSADVEALRPARSHVVRPSMRVDAGSCPRALGRPGRDRRLSRQARQVRRGDRRLLPTLRRPERARLRGLRRGDPVRAAGGGRRRLKELLGHHERPRRRSPGRLATHRRSLSLRRSSCPASSAR